MSSNSNWLRLCVLGCVLILPTPCPAACGAPAIDPAARLAAEVPTLEAGSEPTPHVQVAANRKKAAIPREKEKSDAGKTPSENAGPRLSILVVGDSLAVGVGMTLNSAFDGRDRVAVRKMGKISTGLDSPGFYDWNGVLKDVLERESFDIVVVMLGANDAHNGSGTQAWGRLYESKYTELLRIPAEKKIKTLVLGLPPMRKNDFCRRVQTVNEAIRNACRLFPETCVYIDSYGTFADEDGSYTNRILVNGEWRTVRGGDGVHFTGTGYLMLGRMVAREALAHSHIPQ